MQDLGFRPRVAVEVTLAVTRYSHSRRMLVGVKQVLTVASVSDGWGWVPRL
jgi:hypothetical protein